MFLLAPPWLALLATIPSCVWAQTTTLTGTRPLETTTGALTGDNAIPSGSGVSYLSYNSTLTLSNTAPFNTTTSLTQLTGGSTLTGSNATTTSGSGTTTTSSIRPTNTQPCNGYVEFCSRKYSNISMVAAHNFPFAKKGNAASNQLYSVTDQLNDGIRMLQGQTHYQNNTIYFCHTSCDLLNAGTLQSQLELIAKWVEAHPYDIITILIGNGDFIDVGNFTDPIENSGLKKYVYTPPQIPMALNAWPTISEMILRQTRVVIFMDYQANQTKVPYILDEFSQLWETPFSPTNASFPCDVQRPPDLATNDAKDRMYMANHNLNVLVSLLGLSLLVPDTVNINQTNAINGVSSLGLMSDTCSNQWGRPPNFLLVDYYNYGNYPGSVFEVAAKANGVTYDGKCCGSTSGASGLNVRRSVGISAATFMAILVWAILG